MQSPIDVTTEEVLYDPELRHNPLELSYWRASTAVAAADDGGRSCGCCDAVLITVTPRVTASLSTRNCVRQSFRSY